MEFPAKEVHRPCIVKSCSVRAKMRLAMRVKFWPRHVRDAVVILEEGNLPQPQFPMCDIMVPCRDLNRQSFLGSARVEIRIQLVTLAAVGYPGVTGDAPPSPARSGERGIGTGGRRGSQG